jgi:hypothetical protein
MHGDRVFRSGDSGSIVTGCADGANTQWIEMQTQIAPRMREVTSVAAGADPNNKL